MWNHRVFRDRREAGAIIADVLAEDVANAPLVLGVPRGGIPVAHEIAGRLNGDLDVVLVHKLGARGNPELAIGAVDEHGTWFLAPHARSLGVSDQYREAEVSRQVAVLRARRRQYARAPAAIGGREVIVVDDGAATGATLAAALRLLRAESPTRLVVAVGVAPPDTVKRLQQEADRVVCPLQPDGFQAVGQYFQTFGQVSDEEVQNLLRPD